MSDKIPTICGDNHLHIPKAVCYAPYFVGAEDKTIIQGADFDLRTNVKAFDGLGNEIPYTVSPSTIDPCDTGEQTFTYTADGVTEERTITVLPSSNPVITFEDDTLYSRPGYIVYTLTGAKAVDGNGRIIQLVCVEGATKQYMSSGTYTLHYRAEDSCGKQTTAEREVIVATGGWEGVDNATINQGTNFDIRSGVKATNNRGQELEYTVSPSELDTCEVGVHTLVYHASGIADAVRTITIVEVSDPVISGASSTLNAEPGVAFDPLEGVSAVDGNGNTLTVAVELEEGYIMDENSIDLMTENGVKLVNN